MHVYQFTNMATIACSHCAMEIQLASSAPGKYQCPNCKGILNVANPKPKQKSVVISPNLQNNVQITLPMSYIFWQRAKLFIFTPIGVIFTVIGLMGVIAHRSTWPAVLIFFGMIFFIPVFFYKSDMKQRKTELALVASNHLLPGQKLVNPNKTGVKWSLIAIFIVIFLLAMISVGFIFVAILLVGGGGYMA